MKLEDIGFYTLEDKRAINTSVSSPMWRCEMLLTGACNFSCPYCRGFETISEPCGNINFNIAQEVLGYWINDGLRNVRFSGGEPTLYKRLPDLVRQCKDGNVKHIAISSNGSRDFEIYQELIDGGVNDFSISLDACCASVGDMMSATSGSWNSVVSNIPRIAEQTYVTVGVVLTKENAHEIVDIVKFAHDLGVADIRIISAAQWNELLDGALDIPQNILDAHPILKYRVAHFHEKVNVRGITRKDCHKCYLVLDDSVVVGNDEKAWHFPCVIAMREGCKSIGEVGPNMRQDRLEWFRKHNSYKDPICKKNCLDVCIDYCNKCDSFKKELRREVDEMIDSGELIKTAATNEVKEC